VGYLHIDNLYKAQEILEFKRCYALEKIHGTSAHVAWRDGCLHFFSGGEKHATFSAIFDAAALEAKFRERFTDESDVTVYGEAYGGKCQHMSGTYGPTLRFVAFDVKIGDSWLAVPNAQGFVENLGLEFVDYALVSTDLEALNAERDKPSTQAVRNGITDAPKVREGVVLRPFYEWKDHRGNRIIAKHKRAEFAERGRPNVELDPSKREMLAGAEAIALEWVTPMRLEHVIDAVLSARDDKEIQMRDTPLVIAAMVEDVTREAAGEITDNAPARKAISQRTVQLFKQRVQRIGEPASVAAVDPALGVVAG
jgi:hypothetical protein